MPVHIKYADNKTTIRVIMEGEWTLPELREVFNETQEFIASAQHPIAVIVDHRKSMKIPRSMMTEIRRMNQTYHPNTQCIIIVGGSALVAALINTLNKVYGQTDEIPYFFVKDLDAAFALLEKQAAAEQRIV